MLPKKVVKQVSFKEKVVYWCSHCKCECLPMKAPIIENKIVDKIEVRFD